jgi:hypothetical protein
MVLSLLSKNEQAYLHGSKEFTAKQKRDIRYRLRKKVANFRDAAEIRDGGRWTRLVQDTADLAATITTTVHDTERNYGGPGEISYFHSSIRTPDPRHVKAVRIY